MQPAVMTLSLSTPPGLQGVNQRNYIDLAQCMSIINRRFYRQGLNMAVAGFKVFAATPGTVSISKLPNTWVTSNAWEKAFRMWDKQQKEDLDEAGGQSSMAKFRDFKVFMTPGHVDQYMAAGSDLNATNLLPFAVDDIGVAVNATGGEWQPSQIVIPNDRADASGTEIDPAEYLLHMVGTNDHNSLSKGVLEGYADSRSYPQSPDPVGPNLASVNNWMRAMFDVGNDNTQVIANATLRNDELPYSQVDYPGGQTQMPGVQLHDVAHIHANSTGAVTLGAQRLKGGNFPCGLIALDWIPFADGGGNMVLQIDLIPGNHRGYLCEPMTEM